MSHSHCLCSALYIGKYIYSYLLSYFNDSCFKISTIAQTIQNKECTIYSFFYRSHLILKYILNALKCDPSVFVFAQGITKVLTVRAPGWFTWLSIQHLALIQFVISES